MSWWTLAIPLLTFVLTLVSTGTGATLNNFLSSRDQSIRWRREQRADAYSAAIASGYKLREAVGALMLTRRGQPFFVERWADFRKSSDEFRLGLVRADLVGSNRVRSKLDELTAGILDPIVEKVAEMGLAEGQTVSEGFQDWLGRIQEFDRYLGMVADVAREDIRNPPRQ